MKRHPSRVLAVAFSYLLALSPILAQGQTSSPSTGPAAVAAPSQQSQQQQDTATDQDERDVVRITTNLVQIDVVVTDKKGRQITDLKADEFEILEDGRPQQITNLSYIENLPSSQPQPDVAGPTTTTPSRDKNAPPTPSARLKPEQVRRTIALVVDDLRTSFESIAYVRHALKKYVDEQMLPSDLVAIVRTSTGIGALQQFTSDKRQLYAAIESVRWYPFGMGGISAIAPLTGASLADMQTDAGTIPGSSLPGGFSGAGRRGERMPDGYADYMDDFRDDIYTSGTLGALNFIVNGLRELPGKKSIVLFSDGFRTYNPEGDNRLLLEMRRLVDLANRAAVTIYTIDPRGLQVLGLTAADNTSGFSPEQVQQQLANRRSAFFESQSGPVYLAEQTGGISYQNNNDIFGAVRRALDDQRGYYLIGYRPDDSTFNPAKGGRRFHKITVKVKRPGLRVRTRGGFFGITDDEAKPVKRSRSQQLLRALSSPFGTNGVDLRLTSLYTNEDDKNSFMSSLIYMDASDFTFKEQPDGWHQAVVDVLALTFGAGGMPINEVNRTETIRARGETYEKLLKNGIIYTLRLPVKQPGGYQLRVAVRDAATERIGSASQFVEVPNIKKDRLALSGIVLMSSDTTAARVASLQQSAAATKEGQTIEPDPSGHPAVRRFQGGKQVDIFYTIYNAKLDRTTRKPQLQTQLRMFRDGRQIYASDLAPFNGEGQADMKRLGKAARLRLGTNLEPGEYVLQVIVFDMLASEKKRVASQWINFEVVK